MNFWDRFYTTIHANRSRVMKIGPSRAAKRGGFPIWTCPSVFVLFCPFWDFPDFSGIFPICSGMVRGFSRFALFLFLGLLRAPTRNGPERVRDTIWTFPEKSGKHPGLETPRFSFSHLRRYFRAFTLVGPKKSCKIPTTFPAKYPYTILVYHERAQVEKLLLLLLLLL